MAEYVNKSKLVRELECGIRAGDGERGFEHYMHINGIDDCVDTVIYFETENVIPIPEGATNGDMFKATFPDLVNSNMDLVDAFNNAKRWWNAPYKGVKE